MEGAMPLVATSSAAAVLPGRQQKAILSAAGKRGRMDALSRAVGPDRGTVSGNAGREKGVDSGRILL
jgi:hypothetical protein